MSPPTASVDGSPRVRMEQWPREAPSTRELLRDFDARRDVVFEALEAAYGDAHYAKLLYLKATNYLLARYQHARCHTALVARPVSLMVDPANSCQLRCPGCVHSENRAFTRDLHWPPGVMKSTAFLHLLERYGPTAISAVLYNYGEPLLNKNLPDFILAARQFGLATSLSTNLSVAFDTERFVVSQPDHVVLSIDGITQKTYARFRKRGDLALVLENVQALVEAKRRHGLNRPILAWRFFPFEHNVHEVDDAIEMARKIGVDQIIIGKPFNVAADDPGVRLTDCEKTGRYDFSSSEEMARRPEAVLQGVAPHPAVDALFAEGWEARGEGLELDEPSRQAQNPCTWLYLNMTVDAADRVMPCCITPAKTKNLVYGTLSRGADDLFNAPSFQLARLGLSDPGAYEKRLAAGEVEAPPYCAQCSRRPTLTYGPEPGLEDLGSLDFERVLFNPRETGPWQLAKWQV